MYTVYMYSFKTSATRRLVRRQPCSTGACIWHRNPCEYGTGGTAENGHTPQEPIQRSVRATTALIVCVSLMSRVATTAFARLFWIDVLVP